MISSSSLLLLFTQTSRGHWRLIPKKWRTTKMLKLPWRASHSCNCCRWSCLICHCSKRWLGNSCLETTVCSSDEQPWRWLHNCVMLNWEIKNTSDKYSSWYPEKQDRVNVVITSVVSGFQQLCSKTMTAAYPDNNCRHHRCTPDAKAVSNNTGSKVTVFLKGRQASLSAFSLRSSP